jgi:hypothetical protein
VTRHRLGASLGAMRMALLLLLAVGCGANDPATEHGAQRDSGRANDGGVDAAELDAGPDGPDCPYTSSCPTVCWYDGGLWSLCDGGYGCVPHNDASVCATACNATAEKYQCSGNCLKIEATDGGEWCLPP